MYQSITTINSASKKPLATKAPTINDNVLQQVGILAQILKHDKPRWPNPVINSGVACQICWWESALKFISNIHTSILCNVNIFVKQLVLFNTIRKLVAENQKVVSSEKYFPSKGKNMNNQNWKGKNNKSGEIALWCCGSVVGGGRCGASNARRDRNYGIGLVGGYGSMGGRVCVRH